MMAERGVEVMNMIRKGQVKAIEQEDRGVSSKIY